MADVKKIATRDSYGRALAELGKVAENVVVLDADLAAATKTGVFKKIFPARHFDCGIAECNMVDVAAGLSTLGLVPFSVELRDVRGGQSLRASQKHNRLFSLECKNLRDARRNFRRRGRREPSMLRGLRADEGDTWHGCYEPF